MSVDEYFPDLNLGSDFDVDVATARVQENIRNRFESVASSGRLYTHFVTAIDKDNFLKVFVTSTKIVLTNALNTHFSKNYSEPIAV